LEIAVIALSFDLDGQTLTEVFLQICSSLVQNSAIVEAAELQALTSINIAKADTASRQSDEGAEELS
jgi:hypothetical protein